MSQTYHWHYETDLAPTLARVRAIKQQEKENEMTEVTKPQTWHVGLNAYVKRVQLSASFSAIEAETDHDAIEIAIARANEVTEGDLHWVPTNAWLND